MLRRDFLKTAAIGSLSLTVKAETIPLLMGDGLASGEEIKNSIKVHELLKTTSPIKFYANRKDQMFKQLIELKEKYGIGRFLFVGPLEEVRFEGFPTKKVYEEIGHQIKEAKERLADYDIKIGWWCAPSLRSGYDSRFHYITDIDGTIIDTSPCPLDPVFSDEFSDNIAEVVRVAAPYMVQFEDDYELSHQPPAVKFGCFCPLHLAEFSIMKGKSYSREELEKKFKTVNKESVQLRGEWAELSKNSLISLAKKIRKKVDEVDPTTVISLCQSGMSDFDGDFTEDLTLAFAGNTTPTVRLYGSSYSSDFALGLPGDIFHALYSIQHLPKEFECFHESDTYPHSRFFMSAAKIRSLMTTAFSYGFDQSLFYLTQYLDNLLEEDGYAKMYLSEAPRFLAIKEAVSNCEVIGCEIIHLPNAHVVVPYNGKRPEMRLNSWINQLGRFGIPYTTRAGQVKLLGGRAVESMTHDQIMQLLSGGLLLDAVAACSLCKMGYSSHLGVTVAPFIGGLNSCYEGLRRPDEYENILGDLQYNWIFAPAGTEGGSFYNLTPSADAEVVTDFLDIYEKPVKPSMVRYENTLGGRVLISAFDLAGNNSSTTFNYKKKEIIRQNIEWAGKKDLPVFVKNLPNVFCVCNEDKTDGSLRVTVINLGSDPVEYFELDFARDKQWSKIEVLDQKGTWSNLDYEAKGRTVIIEATLVLMQPVVLSVC